MKKKIILKHFVSFEFFSQKLTNEEKRELYVKVDKFKRWLNPFNVPIFEFGHAHPKFVVFFINAFMIGFSDSKYSTQFVGCK